MVLATAKRNEGKIEQRTKERTKTEKAEAEEMAAQAASYWTTMISKNFLPLEESILLYEIPYRPGR